MPAGLDGWKAVRARGVRAVVDLSEECGSVGDTVRDNGMRYLRLSARRAGLPEVEELHIVTSWVQQRTREGGGVLVHDASERSNDALVACAVLIKDGASLARALSRLGNTTDVPLSQSQLALLHQFVAQRVVAEKAR
ncbi:MAG TPA: hypothetical protein VFS30_10585 [Dehalococcoidia bacterium]|nr:hypothetical protein [Dehalococcoidia bacterium]